jgi:hypothetical protein
MFLRPGSPPRCSPACRVPRCMHPPNSLAASMLCVGLPLLHFGTRFIRHLPQARGPAPPKLIRRPTNASLCILASRRAVAWPWAAAATKPLPSAPPSATSGSPSTWPGRCCPPPMPTAPPAKCCLGSTARPVASATLRWASLAGQAGCRARAPSSCRTATAAPQVRAATRSAWVAARLIWAWVGASCGQQLWPRDMLRRAGWG